MDGLKKQSCFILRHTNATMTGGITRQVTRVHAERHSTEAHVIGHRYMVDTTDMRGIFLRNLEFSCRSMHSSSRRRDRRAQYNSGIVQQPSRLVADADHDVNF